MDAGGERVQRPMALGPHNSGRSWLPLLLRDPVDVEMASVPELHAQVPDDESKRPVESFDLVEEPAPTETVLSASSWQEGRLASVSPAA